MRKEEVIDLHFGFFKDFGFELHPQNLWFQKSFPEGNQVVFIHYSEYPEINYLEYNLGVRIHAVELIIHKFLPTLSDYSNRSITLIQAPSSINSDFPRRFSIHDNQNLDEAILMAEKFFIQEGFRWLDMMIQPQNLEKAFVEQKEKPFPTQNFVYSAFRGATLARLYNPEDYPALRQLYLEQIKQKEMTPFTIASFLQLLDFLDNLEVNSSFSHP
ncbi:hypothetical protein [Algoriphagus sp. AK58]|uniref:hypothetical protein n=1 Tax=Algoriphagus sp. AK58 TaxID=1406877 RepID=UPI0016502F35|nr:hypothetical protein [Algoriphagus sp. AK58]MBC6366160.1 hypothetical protein [Algoriphagus sp. AK58]